MLSTRITLFTVVLCSVFIGSSYACLPNLMGGSSGGGCCPPGPACPQANHCSSSYVSPPASGPASYAVPPPSSYVQPPQQYAQPPQQYAQPPQQYPQPPIAAVPPPPPPPPPPPSPKYPTGK